MKFSNKFFYNLIDYFYWKVYFNNIWSKKKEMYMVSPLLRSLQGNYLPYPWYITSLLSSFSALFSTLQSSREAFYTVETWTLEASHKYERFHLAIPLLLSGETCFRSRLGEFSASCHLRAQPAWYERPIRIGSRSNGTLRIRARYPFAMSSSSSSSFGFDRWLPSRSGFHKLTRERKRRGRGLCLSLTPQRYIACSTSYN